jgi:hypothetical protein
MYPASVQAKVDGGKIRRLCLKDDVSRLFLKTCDYSNVTKWMRSERCLKGQRGAKTEGLEN